MQSVLDGIGDYQDKLEHMKRLDAVNPNAWDGCIAWHQAPGRNYVCFDMCSEEQQLACYENGNKALRGTSV